MYDILEKKILLNSLAYFLGGKTAWLSIKMLKLFVCQVKIND